jgi:predicted RNA polymerase sigma factor
MGRFEAALARVDRLGAGAARPETWMLRRGDILRQAGRRGEAAEAYRAALAGMDRQSPTVQARPATQALRKELERSLASVARSSEPTPEPAR